MVYIVEEHVYLYAKLGVTVGFGSSSSINSSNETLGCELLPLSRIRSIEDGALRFCHVAREEESSRDHACLFENRHVRCHHASIEVHWEYLISGVITLQINN